MTDRPAHDAVTAALAGYAVARETYCRLLDRLQSGEDPTVIVDDLDQMASRLSDIPLADSLSGIDSERAAELAAQAQAAKEACRVLLEAIDALRRQHGAAVQQEARQAKAVRGYMLETRPGEARYLDTEG